MEITIDAGKCIGCGTCARVCPVGLYKIRDGKAVVNLENLSNCLECHACEVQCPHSAIKLR
jgi:NAD-dependent dihydropyrimidine dehydrogenase PreA subunit